ncbi:MAG: hypothetical protein GY850_45415 [bacterium]|nr:hypothetical protein [bacterium]
MDDLLYLEHIDEHYIRREHDERFATVIRPVRLRLWFGCACDSAAPVIRLRLRFGCARGSAAPVIRLCL